MFTRLSQVLATAIGLVNLYLLFALVKSVFGMFATWHLLCCSRGAERISDVIRFSFGEAFLYAFGLDREKSDSFLEFVDALLFSGIGVAAIIGLLIFNFIVHGKVTIWPK